MSSKIYRLNILPSLIQYIDTDSIISCREEKVIQQDSVLYSAKFCLNAFEIITFFSIA